MTAITGEQTVLRGDVPGPGGKYWMAVEETLSIRESQARLLLAGARARLDQLEQSLVTRRATGH
jgi:hypothetical protein